MYAKQFNIDKNKGRLHAYFRSDWMHSIFENKNADPGYQQKAQVVLFSEISASVVSMLYFQAQQNSTYTVASLYCLLYSVMSLSNATKN
jgi:hypothetical protein